MLDFLEYNQSIFYILFVKINMPTKNNNNTCITPLNTSTDITSAIVWFRQDLRLNDNPALFEACNKYARVIPIYVMDKNSILGEAQAWWLHYSLLSLKRDLKIKLNLNLIFRKGDTLDIFIELISEFNINAVYWNRCYEPFRIEQDKNIKSYLKNQGLDVLSFKANLLHEPWTIVNKNSEFYKVFTPYWNVCKQNLISIPSQLLIPNFSCIETNQIKSDKLDDWNLLPKLNWASRFSELWAPGETSAQQKLEKFISNNLNGYKNNRDIPEISATSHLSPHLHFGEISPWSIVRAIEIAKLSPSCDFASAERFLSELGWREFSYYLLFHFPELPHKNFKSQFDSFPWHNDDSLLICWQKGMTGYPIVDAGMRELWATGYMHNRVRMIVASFLTKGLFIDWRRGADWFCNTLLDADLANNSASWQWVAGCGADAAPYFRIFNPILQSQKFDPNGEYIRRWVPELSSLDNKYIHAPWESPNASVIYIKTRYPKPIINHSEARVKALNYYKNL